MLFNYPLLKVVVIQSNYLPWKGYFDLIHDADLFVFYDEVKYTKNDWRNRNKIYPVNGMQWLTIPIDKDAVKLKISEVQITDKNWQQLHYKTLSEGYKRAPFFFQLEPILNEVYLENNWDNLSQLNQFLIKKLSALIGIKTKFANSKEFDLKGEREDRLINLLIQAHADEYISGPSAKDYLSGKEHLFSQHSIQLTYKIYPDYAHYKQLSEPFRHDVSIVDLIAHIKFEEIKNYIWSFKN